MKKILLSLLVLCLVVFQANAQDQDTVTVKLTLEEALQIALSENVAVKVADMEIERNQYARKGTYAALFPQISGSGTYQRTIEKQVMYMDGGGSGGGMTSLFTGIMEPIYKSLGLLSQGTGIDISSALAPPVAEETEQQSNDGITVGRWNMFSGGITAQLPLINAQLWKSIAISGKSVELAVESARSSRLDMVTQVKQAFYAVLMAKQAFEVYKSVYENAVANFNQTESQFKVQKASELDLTRSKVNVANAIPNVYTAESQIELALWQLKAVMGIDLDRNIDVVGELADYTDQMFRDIHEHDDFELKNNTSMRQLAIQAEQLAQTVKLQKYAYLPSLALAYTYNINATTNDFNFSQYNWNPYSYIGISLTVPIFSGGKRRTEVKQAQIRANELDLQAVNTERQLKIAIRQYLNTMETNMNSFYAANNAVELAQKAYNITEKSYNLGKSTITDLNSAQLSLTQAQLSESQAVYNFIVAKSNLEKTLGHDFIDEDGNIDLNNR